MIDERELVRRAVQALAPPEPAFERLLRRRDLKVRNRKLSAGATAIALALLGIAFLVGSFRGGDRPADESAPKPPGIFSEVGGWIAYGNQSGISEWSPRPSRCADPAEPGEGDPVAWSSDGSKLLISRQRVVRDQQEDGVHRARNLFVLNADGSETRLTEGDHWIERGSFSPDGTKVVYSEQGRAGRSVDLPGRRRRRHTSDPANALAGETASEGRRTRRSPPTDPRSLSSMGWGARGPSSW